MCLQTVLVVDRPSDKAWNVTTWLVVRTPLFVIITLYILTPHRHVYNCIYTIKRSLKVLNILCIMIQCMLQKCAYVNHYSIDQVQNAI